MDEAAALPTQAAAPPQPSVMAQAAFDRLNAPAASRELETKQKASGKLGRVEDLKLDYQYQGAPMEQAMRQLKAEPEALAEKRVRKERSALPEAQAPLSEVLSDKEQPARKAELSVRIFESEIDPFEFSLLDSGHFVLFRKVWRDGQRYIQGLLLEQRAVSRRPDRAGVPRGRAVPDERAGGRLPGRTWSPRSAGRPGGAICPAPRS